MWPKMSLFYEIMAFCMCQNVPKSYNRNKYFDRIVHHLFRCAPGGAEIGKDTVPHTICIPFQLNIWNAAEMVDSNAPFSVYVDLRYGMWM